MASRTLRTESLVALAIFAVWLAASTSASAIDSVQQAIVTPACEQNMRTAEMMKRLDADIDSTHWFAVHTPITG
jgi:hypothetical protein